MHIDHAAGKLYNSILSCVVIVSQKTPVNKLVRVDSANPAGRLHAFLHKKRSTVDEPSQTENNLAATRFYETEENFYVVINSCY